MQEPISQRTNRFYEFGPFRFYLTERELYQGAERVALPPKALDTLALLLSRHGRLVDKDELMKVVWPDTFVEESNLVFQISQLRKTLGEGPNGTPYIETVPRRGYRFAAVVTESWDAEPSAGRLDIVREDGPPSAISRHRLLPWAVAAVSLCSTAALLLTGSPESLREQVLPPLRRFAIKQPVHVGYQHPHRVVVISPNGRYIAFADAARGSLWIQDLERGEPRAIENSDSAYDVFWSPDSTFVGFFSGSELKKVSVHGGSPIRICRLPDGEARGGTWSPDLESIIFSAVDGRGLYQIYEVQARGGTPTSLISPEDFEGYVEQPVRDLHWPQFIPSETGGRVLLFAVGSPGAHTLAVRDLVTGQHELLAPGTKPFYSRSGHVVYQPSPLTNELWALPFSAESLDATGDAFLVSESGQDASVADDQTLVQLSAPQANRQQLVWVDRRGETTGRIGQSQGNMIYPSLSPDEKHVAVSAMQNSSRSIWIWDTARGVKTSIGGRATSAWSPAGNELAFTSGIGQSAFDIHLRRVDGGGDQEVLAATPQGEFLNDWSSDGKYLIYELGTSAFAKDLWYLEREENSNKWQSHSFLETPSNELAAQFSPGGHFVAYVSNESGRNEVYVRHFPEGEGRIAISSNGGRQPRWSKNGKELFYLEASTLVSVPVSTAPGLSVGAPRRLFTHFAFGSGGRYPQYDVSSDGERFILAVPVEDEDAPTEIHVVQNWYEEFRDRQEQ